MKYKMFLVNLMSSRYNLMFTFLIINSLMYAQNNWDKAESMINQLDQVTSFADKTYEIGNFGAKDDGITPCKEAFAKAITNFSETGGGTIAVATGNYYLNGSLVLKSNVHIKLEAGAILNFSYNENDYLPEVLTRWEGTEVYNFSPLIYAYHVKNIAITGKGTINENGSKYFCVMEKISGFGQKNTSCHG